MSQFREWIPGGVGVDVADAAATLAPIEVNVQVGQRRDAMGRMAPKCDVAQCRSNSKGGPTALPPLHSGPARAAQASEVASGGDLNASPVRHRHDFNSDNPKLLSRATRSINIGVLSRYLFAFSTLPVCFRRVGRFAISGTSSLRIPPLLLLNFSSSSSSSFLLFLFCCCCCCCSSAPCCPHSARNDTR